VQMAQVAETVSGAMGGRGLDAAAPGIRRSCRQRRP